MAISPEIKKRNEEFNSIDQDAVQACRGRHWATGLKYMHFTDCTEKLSGKRYSLGEVQYLSTSATKFQNYNSFLQKFSQIIEQRRLSLREIKATLMQVNSEMQNLKTDITPVVNSLPAIPSSSDMILEANADYRSKIVQSIELMKNVESVCYNKQSIYLIKTQNVQSLVSVPANTNVKVLNNPAP